VEPEATRRGRESLADLDPKKGSFVPDKGSRAPPSENPFTDTSGTASVVVRPLGELIETGGEGGGAGVDIDVC